LDDLNNFKSDATVRQWAKKSLNFNLLSLSKRERKTNHPIDSYFKDTLRAVQSKTDKAPKQIAIQVFQFFDPALAQLQECELSAHKVC